MSKPARREISAEELEAVFKLAATHPDLRTLPAQLAEVEELRKRVNELQRLAGGGEAEEVRPKTVTDLLNLQKAGYLTPAQIAERLHLPIPANKSEERFGAMSPGGGDKRNSSSSTDPFFGIDLERGFRLRQRIVDELRARKIIS